VIVCDDGSSCALDGILDEFSGALRLSYVRQEDRGFRAGAARNLGIRRATGDLVIFVDDDVLCPENFVAAHVAAHVKSFWSRKPRVALGYASRLATAPPVPITARELSAGEPDGRRRVLGDRGTRLAFHPHPWYFVYSANMSIPNSENPVLFDENFIETHDVWANQFALRGGRSIYLNRKATVRELLEPELTYAALADVLVHVNADDCAFFTDALPGKNHVLLYPNADLKPPKPPAEHFLVVANAHHANYLNVTWFLDRVAPLVRDLDVRIVGRVDELFRKDAPTAYERYRSAFVGFVEDLNPWYESAIAVLLPEVAGTGLSIKTIEAMSTGAPLIATRLAFRGINADFSNVDNVWLADEPGDFARSMREAVKRRGLELSALRTNGEARGAANALRANARTRAVYEELFSFERYRREIARIAALARKEVPLQEAGTTK
jgi:glycosyltransferase involved in cell wall biosynthesis